MKFKYKKFEMKVTKSNKEHLKQTRTLLIDLSMLFLSINALILSILEFIPNEEKQAD